MAFMEPWQVIGVITSVLWGISVQLIVQGGSVLSVVTVGGAVWLSFMTIAVMFKR